MSTGGAETGRVVRKVVITYTTQEDPKTERTLTLEHGGSGEQIDGVIWGDDLMRKLAYQEGDVCREPKKEPGTGEWKVYSAQPASGTGDAKLYSTTQESGARTNCVWVHDPDCMWWSYCPK